MKKYSIVSVGCNCAKYVNAWYKSLTSQTVKDFECFIAIDLSSDDTFKVTRKIIKGDNRFKIVNYNKNENYGALRNRCLCTKAVKNPESVIMHMDLDDTFYTRHAMRIVANAYHKHKCWLTYGSYTSNKGGHWNRPIPPLVWKKNSHRKNVWSTSALRTFKKWLWDRIDQKDFLMSDGSWIKRGTDLAFMFPMLEMAGKKRVHYIKKIIYYYNIYGQQTKEQLKHERSSVRFTRKKKSYKRIKDR